MAKHRHRFTPWRPLGNGYAIYNRECLSFPCKKFEELTIDYTDFDVVQLATGGFKLVKVPGKAFAQIMAQFNYIQQAFWVCALMIAQEEGVEIEDVLFYSRWAECLLFPETP